MFAGVGGTPLHTHTHTGIESKIPLLSLSGVFAYHLFLENLHPLYKHGDYSSSHYLMQWLVGYLILFGATNAFN